jgi:transposase
MRFYTQAHQFYCGIDLHARSMYLCILDPQGEIQLHRNMATTPEAFLKAVQPFRDDLVVAVECIFTWYWLADLCTREDIDFVLGHALYMKAIHGGKAKNDKIDAYKIASLLRGGTLAQAYVYPPEMRATRDLLRRRNHLVNKRAELLAHIQNTNSQYNLPAFTNKIARRSTREGLAERFTEDAVRRSVELDLALIETYDRELDELERHIVKTAKEHDPRAFAVLRSVPGIGRILALIILYEMHTVERFPKVGNFLSYARLVKCARESAGKTYGTSGHKIGNAHLRWAFGEAACLFLRNNPDGQRFHQRLVSKHGKAKALSVIAQKLGRAVYIMLKRNEVFDMKRFLQR